jgi:hypothetical protein
VISTSLEEMRRLADRILEEIGRPVPGGTAEACRRLVAGKATEDETRDLVRDLLRGAAERRS